MILLRTSTRIALGAAALAVCLPEVAEACAVCTGSQEEQTRTAFIVTTAFLTFLPLTVFGGAVWWLRRRLRALEGRVRGEGDAPLPATRASSSL